MKALSLWEPWATLIAFGLKRYETRSWSTIYRGPLLICASKKRLPLADIIGLLYLGRLTLNDLQFGRAVATVDLVDILKTDDLRWGQLGEIEEKLGDLSSGRYAWKLNNIRRFLSPPPVVGHQGLFDVDECYAKLEIFNF